MRAPRWVRNCSRIRQALALGRLRDPLTLRPLQLRSRQAKVAALREVRTKQHRETRLQRTGIVADHERDRRLEASFSHALLQRPDVAAASAAAEAMVPVTPQRSTGAVHHCNDILDYTPPRPKRPRSPIGNEHVLMMTPKSARRSRSASSSSFASSSSSSSSAPVTPQRRAHVPSGALDTPLHTKRCCNRIVLPDLAKPARSFKRRRLYSHSASLSSSSASSSSSSSPHSSQSSASPSSSS